MQHFNLLLLLVLQSIRWTTAAPDNHFEASTLYDWGYHGGFPRMSYQSFGAQSPRPNLVQTSRRCDDGYIFIEPRGHFVDTPGPVMLDNNGNLVWMQTQWGQVMDVKVQTFQGKDYITFWHGSDSGTFGTGQYVMLDESYEVFKTITPVGDYNGDLHEFRITENGTALMTMYRNMAIDMSSYDIEEGWIFDSIFQEVDLVSGELIFEWHASKFYDVEESLAPLNGDGVSPEKAFDFFHINSIDKDAEGNYLISSRYMCAVACVSHVDGAILWQLGGESNSFEDLSDGAATDISWNHHAAWYQNKTLTLFDNGSNGHQKTAKFSRGLMVDLDLDDMTATLVQAYVAPQKFLSPSQGSVQVLSNGNVLVGWGHVPAFTEFSMDGEVLCDTHIGPVNFDTFGFVKNYRTFKYNWVGKPKTLPDVAMRPKQNSLFVSWNGATEVAKWVLQSGPKAQDDGHNFREHFTVMKSTFETQLMVPKGAELYVRAVALDINGKVLAYSPAVSRHEHNTVKLLEAPPREKANPFHLLFVGLSGAFVTFVVAFSLRQHIRRGVKRLLEYRGSFGYQALPTHK